MVGLPLSVYEPVEEELEITLQRTPMVQVLANRQSMPLQEEEKKAA
ncbi:MAG: hypothetical protein KBD90_05790 [Alphaproteobacteria bacterium]|nr:hypothetical protein [Alphaproteobacteria bacterium]